MRLRSDTPVVLANTPQHLLDPNTFNKPINWEDRLHPKARFTLGFCGALFCGLFFGLNFVPPEHQIANKENDQRELDYVFSHFCGIFATSTLFLVIYCVYMKNAPKI